MNAIKSNKGSVIIACMIIAIIVAIFCGTYLAGVLGDYKLSMRSLKSNSALNLAEAGIDVAMYALKQGTISGTNSDGTWTQVGSGATAYYQKTIVSNKSLGSGDVGTAVAIVENLSDTTNGPIITAQGKISQAGSPVILKQVRVNLKPLSGGSIPGPVSYKTVNTNGQNVIYDGYDSKFGAYGAVVPAGSSPAKGRFRTVNGQLVNICDGITFTIADPSASFAINKNIIWGRIALVGACDKANHYSNRITWQWDNDNGGSVFSSDTSGVKWNPKVQTGSWAGNPPVYYDPANTKAAYFDDNMVITNATFKMPDYDPKPTSGTIVYAPTNDTPLELGDPNSSTPKVYIMRLANNPSEVLNVNVNLSGKNKIIVKGPSILVVDGFLDASGSEGGITINDTGGAYLRLYVKNNIKITGNGLVNNNSDADTLVVIPTGDSGQEIQLGGNGRFCGTAIAPDRVVHIIGNGAWYGSVVAGSIDITGNGGFHFDVSSGKWLGGSNGYTVKNWIELTNTAGTTYQRDSRLTSL